MSGNVVGVEGWPGESTDGVGRVHWLALAPQRRIIEIWPENRLGGFKRLRTESSLSPAHHMRVEPCGLHGIGPGGAFPPHQQIAAAFPHHSVWRNLQAAV